MARLKAALNSAPTSAPSSTAPSKRPQRTGVWFIADKDLATTLEHDGLCDIFEEFLKDHPNGGAAAAGFVMIKLSQAKIKQYRKQIRISSYRWADMKGSEGAVIPGNYGWFLEHIRKNKVLGWMDWMANVGVNVPTPETLAYMGSLYADSIVLGDWMTSVDRLFEALKRAWIYQEMARDGRSNSRPERRALLTCRARIPSAAGLW